LRPATEPTQDPRLHRDKKCRTEGCANYVRSDTWAPLCPSCRATMHRHGHPKQPCISPIPLRAIEGELGLLLRQVLRTEEAGRLRYAMEEGFLAFRAHVEDAAQRDPNKYTREAAKLLLKVLRNNTAEEVTLRAVAMLIYRDRNPKRFVDDASFRVQMCRMVRQLAGVVDSSHWDNKAQRVKSQVRRKPLRRTQLIAGSWLVTWASIPYAQLAPLLETKQQRDIRLKALYREAFGPAKEALVLEHTAIGRLMEAARDYARLPEEQRQRMKGKTGLWLSTLLPPGSIPDTYRGGAA
jgi:hypothetical protein